MMQNMPGSQILQPNTPIGQHDAWLQVFLKGEPRILGVVQILIGIINALLTIVLLATTLSLRMRVLVVVWAQIFFVVSGSLSVCAEKKRSRPKVKAAVGMNIVSAIGALFASVIYVVDLCRKDSATCRANYTSMATTASILVTMSPGGGNITLISHISAHRCYDYYLKEQSLRTGLLAVLFIITLLELGIAVSTSLFGLKSLKAA